MNSKYLILLLISTALTALLNFLCQVYIANHTNPKLYGLYSTYLTFTLLFIPILTLGMSNYLLKKVSEDKKNAKININDIAVILFSCLFGLVLVNVILNLYFNNLKAFEIFLLSMGILAFAIHELYLSYLVGGEKRKKILYWQPFLHFTRLILLLLFIYLFDRLEISNIVLMTFFTGLVVLVVFVMLLGKEIDFHVEKLSFNKIRNIVRSSIWFGLIGFLYIVYSQINIIYIDKLVGSIDAGYFNIGYTFLLMSLIIPTVFYNKFLLPKLHKMYKNDRMILKNIYNKGIVLSFFFGCIVSFVLNLIAKDIIILFYGQDYIESIIYFKYITMSIPLFYLSIHVGIFSYIGGFQKYKVYGLFFVTIFSIIINYFLVINYEVMGAIFGLNLVILTLSIVYAILNKIFIFNGLDGLNNETN